MIKKSAGINPVIRDDIQRYRKNKLSSVLALFGLAFCCAYFIVLYAQVKNNDYYYKWPIALDVIYNLVFLLFVFLFSEQVKNYNRKLFWLQMFFGVMQVVRIFWLPLAGVTETVYPELAGVAYSGRVLSAASFICMVVFLACSGACVIASGITGLVRSKNLEDFNKKIENGEISVEAALKELEPAEKLPFTESEEITNA